MSNLSWRHLILLGAFLTLASVMPLGAKSIIAPSNIEQRLRDGEVVVGLRETGGTKYVTGSVLIDAPPDKVWPIMVNPFEFRRHISPRMKEVEVMKDQSTSSILRVTLDVILIPHFTYVVESTYENGARVDFKRIGGILKDFRGSWQMCPTDGGTQTQLTYCMYIDPGFPVPQWIIREGVKGELPRTLIGLRNKVNAVLAHTECMEKRTILAATLINHKQ
jgi:hypothetical protein